MADWTRREVVTRRVEYVLPSPTNVAELGKVYAALMREPAVVGNVDDVCVEGRDDEIVFSFEAAE